MATTITKLLFRRGSDSDRTSTTLSMGEPGWVTVKNRLFVGDGTTAGGRAVPLTDERYFEWGSGSSDESDDFNAVTGFTDDGTEFLTLNKAGLSGFLEQCFVPKVPTSSPNTLMGPVLIDPGYLQIEGDLDVNGSADISENLDLHGYLKVLTGPTNLKTLDVSGDVTLGTNSSNKVTVKGDLIVDGNTVTKNDVSTKDTRLYLNTDVTSIGTGINDDTQTHASSTVTEAGLYINTVDGQEKCYFRVGSSDANLELKAPTGGQLTLDVGSDSTYKADGNLTVESGVSKINQDVTSDANVNFGSITTGAIVGTSLNVGTGTITSGAITSTSAIVGTSLNVGTGAIASGAITSSSAIAGTSLDVGNGAIASGAITSSSTIQGTIITATDEFVGNLDGNVDGNVDGIVGGNTPAEGTFTDLYANTKLRVGNGSVGFPSISFQNDGNTGFYHISDNQLGVTTNGVNRGYFSTNGWIGDVEGNVDGNAYSASRVAIHASSSTTNLRLVFTADDNDTGTAELLYKDSSTSIFYQPGNDILYAANLTLRPDGTSIALQVDDTYGVIANNSGTDSCDFRCKWSNVSTPEDSGDKGYALFVNADTAKIGIGTNNPQKTLDVIGSIRSSTDIYATNFHGDGTNLDLANNPTIDVLPSQSTHSGKFLTTNGTTATWASVDAFPPYPNGNGILIGGGGANGSTAWHDYTNSATTIQSQLRISQSGHCIFYFGDNKTDNGSFLVRKGSTDGTDYFEFLHIDEEGLFKLRNGDDSVHTAGSLTLQNDVNGNLAVRGNVTAYYSFSDKRLKKNIKAIDSSQALEQVNSLQSVEFKWKDDRDDSNQIGLIAQEVEKIVPEVVSTRDRLDDSVEEGVKPYKHIEYEKLVPLLIESVKVLTNRIEELEARDK